MQNQSEIISALEEGYPSPKRLACVLAVERFFRDLTFTSKSEFDELIPEIDETIICYAFTMYVNSNVSGTINISRIINYIDEHHHQYNDLLEKCVDFLSEKDFIDMRIHIRGNPKSSQLQYLKNLSSLRQDNEK